VNQAAFFGTEDAHMVDGLQAGEIVLLEDHAGLLQRRDGSGDVIDAEADCRVFGLRSAGFREQRDYRAAAGLDEFSIRLLAARLEPELILVEVARAACR
jgi:hypothetical protein